MLSHTFNISTMSSFDSASFFFLTTLGSFTFNLNFLGVISTSQYSRKFFTVTIRCLNVDVVILHFRKYAAYPFMMSYGSNMAFLILEINSNLTTRLLVNGRILDGKYWQTAISI